MKCASATLAESRLINFWFLGTYMEELGQAMLKIIESSIEIVDILIFSRIEYGEQLLRATNEILKKVFNILPDGMNLLEHVEQVCPN